MELVKTIQKGKTKIEIYSNFTPEEKKRNLIKLHDKINEIADKKRAEGINVDSWFYTEEQLNEIIASGNYNLL